MLYCLQTKCELYWPQQISESREFGKITVTLIECSEFSEFTKRLMKIEHEVMTDLKKFVTMIKAIQNEIQTVLHDLHIETLSNNELSPPLSCAKQNDILSHQGN